MPVTAALAGAEAAVAVVSKAMIAVSTASQLRARTRV